MPRKTKIDVIESLTLYKVEFDPEANYNDLAKLLKEVEATEAQKVALDAKEAEEKNKAAAEQIAKEEADAKVEAEKKAAADVLDADAHAKADAKAKENAKLEALHTESGISMKVLKVGREVGLTVQQLTGWTDEEKLKATIIRIKPAMATRFVHRPRPSEGAPVVEPRFTDAVAAFDVTVLAGMGPTKQRVVSEERDIDVQMKRRGIVQSNVTSVNVFRSMKADANNRLHSTVTIRYKKPV